MARNAKHLLLEPYSHVRKEPVDLKRELCKVTKMPYPVKKVCVTLVRLWTKAI